MLHSNVYFMQQYSKIEILPIGVGNFCIECLFKFKYAGAAWTKNVYCSIHNIGDGKMYFDKILESMRMSK